MLFSLSGPLCVSKSFFCWLNLFVVGDLQQRSTGCNSVNMLHALLLIIPEFVVSMITCRFSRTHIPILSGNPSVLHRRFDAMLLSNSPRMLRCAMLEGLQIVSNPPISEQVSQPFQRAVPK